MEKILILVVAVSVLGGVNSLQCYRCTNCTEVKSEQLVTCGANTTVTTTTQRPNTTTTTLTPSTTTTTTQNPNSTTLAPNSTSTTVSTSTTQNPNSTLAPNTTSTTTSTTTTVTPSNGTANSTLKENQENPKAPRRSADDEEENCFCDYKGDCNCHGLRIVQFLDAKATETYVCVKDTIHVNGATVINRGCAVKQNQTVETCVGSAFSSNCTVCETDKCNGAASINFSMIVLVTSFFAAVTLV